MTETAIPDTIKHLDFDVAESNAIPCSGVMLSSLETGLITFSKNCKRPAELRTFTACCGTERMFCLDCYQETIKQHIIRRDKGTKIVHLNGCGNEYPMPPFMSPQFI